MIYINLVPSHLRKKQSAVTTLNVLKIPTEMLIGLGGGIVALLVIFHVLFQVLIVTQYLKNKQYENESGQLAQNKKEVDSILNELRGLQGRVKSLEDITEEKRIVWAPKLNAISDNVARGVWLNQITLDGKLMRIEGSAVSKTKNEVINIGNFTSGLKNDKNFMQNLTNLELGAIQRRNIASTEIVDFIITATVK